MVIVITNIYADGFDQTTSEVVTDPAELSEDWWEDVIFPLTGTGHGGVATYTASITDAANPAHIGQSYEWSG